MQAGVPQALLRLIAWFGRLDGWRGHGYSNAFFDENILFVERDASLRGRKPVGGAMDTPPRCDLL